MFFILGVDILNKAINKLTSRGGGFYKLTVFGVIFWGQIILIGCYLITEDKHHIVLPPV